MNWIAILLAALVPMALGFVYYNPKVVGNAWMKAAGVTPEMGKTANMPLIYGLCLFFAFLLSLSLQSVVIHQMGSFSLVLGVNSPEADMVRKHIAAGGDWYHNYRSFGHGFLHGVLISIGLVLPVFATNAMFERKSFKYVLINVFYWTLTISIMGGILCAWPK